MKFRPLPPSPRLHVLLGTLGLALLLGACNPNPPAPPSSAKGYVLEVRGGTTNIDSSFLNLAQGGRPEQQVKLAKLRNRLPGALSQSLVFPQNAAAVGVNFYVSITKDGKPFDQELSLSLAGPRGKYPGALVYEANQAWSTYFPFPSTGTGTYQISTKVEGIELAAKTFIETSSAPLSIPTNLRAAGTATSIAARWDAVPGAQSYVVLIYNYDLQDYIWGSIGKTTYAETDDLTLKKNGKYGLILFALSWDATLPSTKDYPAPIPARFDASVVETSLYVSDPDITEPAPNPALLMGQPGQGTTVSISFTNDAAGLLTYTASLNGADEVKIVSGSKGKLLPNEASKVDLAATCPSSEVQTSSVLTIATNDPDEPSKSVLVKLECLFPTRAELIITKLGTSEVNAAEWSPDGSKIATAGGNGRVFVWDAVTGEPLRVLQGVKDVSWSPDSKYLLVGMVDGATVWDTTDGTVIRTVGLQDGTYKNIEKVAWSPDGAKLAIATSDQVGIFRAADGLLLVQFTAWGSNVVISDLEWSPDSTKIATTSMDAVIWNASTGSEVLRIGGISGPIAWSSDGSQVAGASFQDGSVRIYDATSGTVIRTIGTSRAWPSNLVWNGDQLAGATLGSIGLKVDIWRISDGALIQTIPVGGSITTAGVPLDWSPDGQQIVTAPLGGLGKTWNVSSGQVQTTLGYHTGDITTLEFNAASTQLLSGAVSAYQGVSVLNWMDLNTGNKLGSLEVGSYTRGLSAKWLETSGRLAAVFEDYGMGSNFKLHSWDILTKTVLSTATLPFLPETAWSPDGKWLAVSADNSSIKIYNVLSGSFSHELQDSTLNYRTSISWSPDGSKVAAGSTNPGVVIWNAQTGVRLKQFNNGVSGRLYWSPDGSRLAGSGKIFDANTGEVIASFNQLKPPLAWSNDGRRIAAFTSGVEIFSTYTGRSLLLIPNSEAGNTLAWSNDGRFIATGASSRINVWRITTTP